MSFAKIRPRRGTATQWTTANPVLAEGELAFEVPTEGVGTGLVKIKIGDGVTAWNELPYAVDGSIDLDDFVAQTLDGDETDKVPSVSTVKNAIDNVGMYYDPETDIKYLRNQNGEWVEVGYGGLLKQYLYPNDQNQFIPYLGALKDITYQAGSTLPIITYDDTMSITYTLSGGCWTACVITDLIDVTNCKKLVLKHTSTSTGSSSYESATLFISETKEASMTPLARQNIISASTSQAGLIELELAGISGEVYIGIAFQVNGKSITVNVEEMYLE